MSDKTFEQFKDEILSKLWHLKDFDEKDFHDKMMLTLKQTMEIIEQNHECQFERILAFFNVSAALLILVINSNADPKK